MENGEETVMGYPVMGYPAPAGFLRPSAIYNAPRRSHPPAATTTPAAITRAANPSLAKPVDGSQVQPVGCGVNACGWVLLFVFVVVFAWACVSQYLSPEFKISSLSVSPFNSSSSILKASWNITFSVRNPNYFGAISYERVQVSVPYHGVPLSTESVAPFHRNGLRWRFLEANMEALSSPSAMGSHGG
ncbi:hypothetical protein RHSIM_Rhsim04G0206100 [Rhododendron simsii]|uniref:Late embryogenesis abundant protein LEA-2 subgroup domain-containing protein n=1 Tax=Rhododendron simsii TaxID=118357 RepID=A0A834H357_RHOSS|nr:hypothetical protein RHSIM_Rhsim04G0206100 [Rhododendron simsii]